MLLFTIFSVVLSKICPNLVCSSCNVSFSVIAPTCSMYVLDFDPYVKLYKPLNNLSISATCALVMLNTMYFSLVNTNV